MIKLIRKWLNNREEILSLRVELFKLKTEYGSTVLKNGHLRCQVRILEEEKRLRVSKEKVDEYGSSECK